MFKIPLMSASSAMVVENRWTFLVTNRQGTLEDNNLVTCLMRYFKGN